MKQFEFAILHYIDLIKKNELDAIIITNNINKIISESNIDCLIITNNQIISFAKWLYYPYLKSYTNLNYKFIIYKFENNFHQLVINYLIEEKIFNIGCFSDDIMCDFYFKLLSINSLNIYLFEENLL